MDNFIGCAQFSMCFDIKALFAVIWWRPPSNNGITHNPLCFDSIRLIRTKGARTHNSVFLQQGLPPTRHEVSLPQGMRFPSRKAQGLPPAKHQALLPGAKVKTPAQTNTLPGSDLGVRRESLVPPNTIFSHLCVRNMWATAYRLQSGVMYTENVP
jgi:hypothetical protein